MQWEEVGVDFFSGGILVNSNSIVRTLSIKIQAGTPSESEPAPGAACPRARPGFSALRADAPGRGFLACGLRGPQGVRQWVEGFGHERLPPLPGWCVVDPVQRLCRCARDRRDERGRGAGVFHQRHCAAFEAVRAQPV